MILKKAVTSIFYGKGWLQKDQKSVVLDEVNSSMEITFIRREFWFMAVHYLALYRNLQSKLWS